MNKNKKYTYAVMALATLTTIGAATPAFAETTVNAGVSASAHVGFMGGRGGRGGMMNHGNMKPMVFGTVSSISGNTIIVSGKQGFGSNATNVTYSIDATNAKVTKDNTAGTIASIAVGDMVMVQGTVTGTNVVATEIHDGVMKGRGDNENKDNNQNPKPISTMTGNGQPVVAGTVSSVSGSTIVITNKSNVTYTIDATNAKITKGQAAAATVTSVAVGDQVVVQGVVNGNSIVASSVIDENKPSGSTGQQHKGFFGSIGSFFGRIFGF